MLRIAEESSLESSLEWVSDLAPSGWFCPWLGSAALEALELCLSLAILEIFRVDEELLQSDDPCSAGSGERRRVCRLFL